MGPLWQGGFQASAPSATARMPQWGAPGARAPVGNPVGPAGIPQEPMMPPGGEFNGQFNGQMGPMGSMGLPAMPWGKGAPPSSTMIMQNLQNLLPMLQKMNLGSLGGIGSPQIG